MHVLKFSIVLIAVLAVANGGFLVSKSERVVLKTTPEVADLGTLSPKAKSRTAVTLTNASSSSVVVLGAKPTCGCVVFKGFPVTLAPHGSATVEFTIVAPDEGEMEYYVSFWCDRRPIEQTSLKIQGHVAQVALTESAIVEN